MYWFAVWRNKANSDRWARLTEHISPSHNLSVKLLKFLSDWCSSAQFWICRATAWWVADTRAYSARYRFSPSPTWWRNKNELSVIFISEYYFRRRNWVPQSYARLTILSLWMVVMISFLAFFSRSYLAAVFFFMYLVFILQDWRSNKCIQENMKGVKK